jgi:hypothetical protein
MRCDVRTRCRFLSRPVCLGSGLLATALVAGCAKPAEPVIRMSDESLSAGREFVAQYEPLKFESRLSPDLIRTIDRTSCRLIVPPDWTQTSRTWFERDGSAADGGMPQTIKVIEHATVDGSLEKALDRFSCTARAMVENYNEQHRWRLELDGMPAVAIQYEHTEESFFPGQVAVTRAYFTVKADRFEEGVLRTVVISCTAPRESFESVSPVFDEVAGRVDFIESGT